MDERFMNELLAKRADCTKVIQALVAEAEGKQLDADQSAKFENAMKDFDSLDMQIKALEKTKVSDVFEKVETKLDENTAIANYIRAGKTDGVKFTNDMSTADGSAGAIVPNKMYSQIVQAMYDTGAMLKLADVFTTDVAQLDIPVSSTVSTAYWVAEGGTRTSSDIAFNQVVLTPKTAVITVLASRQLIADSAFDVASYIAGDAGTQLGRLLENYFINGATNPRGVMVSASQALTSSVTASFSYGDIVSLYGSVITPYRMNGSFLCADTALTTIMQLTDGEGHYIFAPSYVSGQPDKLLGRPLLTSEYMPTITSSAKSIMFGDFKYYKIAQRASITMQRLVELYAGTGQIGFQFELRVDGGLTNTNAVKYMALK
jgi:HK97 family phage major capsid protein